LKYFKSGGDWPLRAGISRPSALRKKLSPPIRTCGLFSLQLYSSHVGLSEGVRR
jgi:hypothetical protein